MKLHTFQLKFWLYSIPVSVLVLKRHILTVFHIQMDIWISYAAFDIHSRLWPIGQRITCNNFFYVDIWTHQWHFYYLLWYLFTKIWSLFIVWTFDLAIWRSELPKKHLIYYCGHLTWKTYIQHFTAEFYGAQDAHSRDCIDFLDDDTSSRSLLQVYTWLSLQIEHHKYGEYASGVARILILEGPEPTKSFHSRQNSWIFTKIG